MSECLFTCTPLFTGCFHKERKKIWSRTNVPQLSWKGRWCFPEETEVMLSRFITTVCILQCQTLLQFFLWKQTKTTFYLKICNAWQVEKEKSMQTNWCCEKHALEDQICFMNLALWLVVFFINVVLEQAIVRKHHIWLDIYVRYRNYQEMQKVFCIKTIFIFGIMELKIMLFPFEFF